MESVHAERECVLVSAYGIIDVSAAVCVRAYANLRVVACVCL